MPRHGMAGQVGTGCRNGTHCISSDVNVTGRMTSTVQMT